jgi:hypothetical protein
MTRGDWKRVSKARPCPVCGKGDWCIFTGPEDDPEAAICTRVESGRRIREAGWLHKLRSDGTSWRNSLRRPVRMIQPQDDGRPDLAAEAEAATRWTSDHPEALGRFARDLGLSAESLTRLHAGYSPRRRAWTFPMKDAADNVTGIRLRLGGGRKLSVKGGKEGLFIPEGIEPGGRLLVAEGPTDTAAALDLGQAAVGRPSCTGGVRLLVELVGRLKPEEVAIASDADEAGWKGAEILAASLLAYCPVRIFTPGDGCKDLRAWLRAGATAGDLAAAIAETPARRLEVNSRRKGGRSCRTETATA